MRPRARWISEEEKTTKHFYNLAKRNFVSKCMNSLVKNSEIKITDQDEILQKHFYSLILYPKRDCIGADLSDLLNEYQVPKLEDADNILLEGPITYDELLFYVKKASNNTSPGFDGYTYEFCNFFFFFFFFFFWKDLCHFLLRAINRCFPKEIARKSKMGRAGCRISERGVRFG